MTGIEIVLEFLPFLVDLAEGIFGDGAGAQKKEFVSKNAVNIASKVEDVSTGGQKETWHKINKHQPSIGRWIDLIAGKLFPPKPKETKRDLGPGEILLDDDEDR